MKSQKQAARQGGRLLLTNPFYFHADNNPLCGNHHNLIFLVDSLYPYNIPGLFESTETDEELLKELLERAEADQEQEEEA